MDQAYRHDAGAIARAAALRALRELREQADLHCQPFLPERAVAEMVRALLAGAVLHDRAAAGIHGEEESPGAARIAALVFDAVSDGLASGGGGGLSPALREGRG